MILGDALMVMASLAERENLRGQVQCIYMDPPYGIKFNSNWQASTGSRDMSDGKAADVSREPEVIRAFRDTWKDGINSYLSYLRDRLTVAKELLSETGSVFVQIGRKCSDWEWRRKHKPAIITGRKQRSTLKVRRDTQNAKMKSDVVIRRAAIQEILAKARLKSGAALEVKIKKQLEADTGKPVSLRTVRRDLQHLRGQP